MCFSAKASFITSALLAGTSALTISHVQRREQIPLALIPVFFTIQQFSEGIIWLIDNNVIKSEILLKIATYMFLFFALVIWPSWISFSVFILERKQRVKNLLLIFLFLGLIFSLSALYILMKYDLATQIDCCHIYYYPLATIFTQTWLIQAQNFYMVLTILPLFLSTRKSLNILGFLVTLSSLLSYLYWEKYFISVWCFFAAILSLTIYLIIRWQNFKNSFEEIVKNY